MIYMVEMALIDLSRRTEWDAWYLSHMKLLISIPGIQATQRFEALGQHVSPFVALHQVTGPAVFTSDAYRAKAGPGGTGIWRERMNNWHRNVLQGLDETPDVPPDGALIVVEDDAAGIVESDAAIVSGGGAANVSKHGVTVPVPVRWTEPVGLDRTITRRGFAVLPRLADAVPLLGLHGVRVCRPLTPRLRAG
jgi:hypothetical protein